MSPERAALARRAWLGLASVVAVLLCFGVLIGIAVGWAVSELVLALMHTIVVDQT